MTSGDAEVREFHPWDPHKAAKDVEVGDYYFKRKNYRAAEDRYREALLYKDNDAIATYRLAICLEKMDRPDEARQEYESYLKILPYRPRSGGRQEGDCPVEDAHRERQAREIISPCREIRNPAACASRAGVLHFRRVVVFALPPFFFALLHPALLALAENQRRRPLQTGWSCVPSIARPNRRCLQRHRGKHARSVRGERLRSGRG